MCFLSVVVLLLLGLVGVPTTAGARAGAPSTGEIRPGRIAFRREVAWPDRYFAPYSLDRSGKLDLAALAQATGTRFFTLAFVVASKDGSCGATWDGKQPVGDWMQASISKLQAAGGDVRVAFGGSAGTELAGSCHTLSSLQSQYQAVIDTYHLTHLDFDIEGQALKDSGENHLRNRAIAALQRRAAAQGRSLVVSYTLPVNVTGLTPAELGLLRDAIASGVTLSVVNLMTMDYHSQRAPGDQMGQNAIRAAKSVFGQLRALYPARSAGQLWSMLGLTPMIGVNDDHQEIFTLQDARAVLNFARKRQIAQLSLWSAQRDRSCTRGEVAPHHCSGVTQQPYQFSQAFAAFTLAAPVPAG
jgi:chitinase